MTPNWVMDLFQTHLRLAWFKFWNMHHFLHIIYFGVVNGDYIEMAKIPQSLKMDLQSLNT
jgi:hypothetical protein